MNKTIELQESVVAGFNHHEGKECFSALGQGHSVILEREPDNDHDANAVAVLWEDTNEDIEFKLGYIPRKENQAIAALIDNNFTLHAHISALKNAPTWDCITVLINLEV